MKSRLKIIVLSLALLLSTLVLTDVNTVKVYADGDITVKFHYTRTDGAYDDWTMWVWNDHETGKGFDFEISSDGSGAVSTYTCSSDTTSIGFIVKAKADWTKDVAEDRTLDIAAMTSGTLNVFLTTGVKEFTTEEDSGNSQQSTDPETTTIAEDPTTVEETTLAEETTVQEDTPAEEEVETDTERKTHDPYADYSASTGTVILVDVAILLLIAVLCFVILGKKKGTK